MIENNYDIKANISLDNENLKDVISKWMGDDDFTQHYFLRGVNTKYTVCSYEAYKNEKLVGLITAWKSNFHPYCTYFAMVTEPRLGYEIETVLIRSLMNYEAIKYPLQTSIWETSYRLKTFYEQSNFIEVRRTYMPLIQISNINLEVFPSPDFNQKDIYINDLKSLSVQPELRNQLIKLVKQNYEKAHTANPVAELNIDKWEGLIFNEDLVENGSFIVLEENEIIAYSFMHYSNVPEKWGFGWRGTRDKGNVKLILMLTVYQINFAKEKGIISIEAEIDSTDDFSIEMLKFFPFAPAPTLMTLHKKKS
jgi:hypothetical protein